LRTRSPELLLATNRSTERCTKPQVDESGVQLFNFHNLKTKGICDFDGDKKTASDNWPEAMINFYDRKRKSVDSTDQIINLLS